MLVVCIITGNGAPVVLKEISEREQGAVPYGDTKERIRKIDGRRLSRGSGDKGDIGAADRNNSSDADSPRAVFSKLFFGGVDSFFCFRKPFYQLCQKGVAAKPSDQIADACSKGSRENRKRKEQEKGDVFRSGDCAGERKDNLAGDREARIFQKNNQKHGKNAVTVKE